MGKFDMTKAEKLDFLNVCGMEHRLANLAELISVEIKPPEILPQFANNHIHTTYSFSPYSPTAAVYFARDSGLETAGIMDHDTIGGAHEFRKAAEIAGISVTCGLECRVDMSETPLSGRRFNNPDQTGVAYMAVHSVMPNKIDYIQEKFAPLREKRNIRNKKMVKKMNEIFAPYGISVDFEKDVIPVSMYQHGGAVTERHLLWALVLKILETVKVPDVAGLLRKIEISLSESQSDKLCPENINIRYDILAILKGQFIKRIFLPASDELLTLKEMSVLSNESGAILCYSYLGDVGQSVTGDKLTEKYEDNFLDELFDLMRNEGVVGITYMPSRNTLEQIGKVQALTKKHGITEISGEDINSPTQSFICEKLAAPNFSHLVEATWKLVERER